VEKTLFFAHKSEDREDTRDKRIGCTEHKGQCPSICALNTALRLAKAKGEEYRDGGIGEFTDTRLRDGFSDFERGSSINCTGVEEEFL
jgi:hypothetical protein